MIFYFNAFSYQFVGTQIVLKRLGNLERLFSSRRFCALCSISFEQNLFFLITSALAYFYVDIADLDLHARCEIGNEKDWEIRI